MRRRVANLPPDAHFAGFDLSLTGTGIVICDKAGTVKEHHVIAVKTRGAERLLQIQRTIRRIISPYNIVLVCIEGYAMGASGHTYGIGELGGVIRVLLHTQGIPYMEPTPGQLKKFATGAGGGEQGSKDQVTMYVFKHWGFTPRNNDEADAFVLSRIALGLKDHGGVMTSYQKEVINTIKNPAVKKPKKKKE